MDADQSVDTDQRGRKNSAQLANDAYTVGWICAISTEYVAARAFLDTQHGSPAYVSQHDNNNYTLGDMGRHHVVIAVLPDGEYGIASAASVARDMLHSFPNVRIGLMVGIGGGAPSERHDIRLGDVVVSAPRNGCEGVFQYDYGKTIQDRKFQPTGRLADPPTVLRAAIAGIKSQYEEEGHQIQADIDTALQRKPRLQKKYCQPNSTTDHLYRSDFIHPSDEGSCAAACITDPSALAGRQVRDSYDDNPVIHYGLIASANQLMKDAKLRDKLAAEKDVLCFEMEAAGLMNHFPCLVIRGICDYSDTHKNKDWQGYAAMAAAAYAKELLQQVPRNKVEAERPILEILGNVENQIEDVRQASLVIKAGLHNDKIEKWLRPPDPSTNANHARGLRHAGTGTWLLEHPVFLSWKAGGHQHTWLHGLAGCGKTVLSTTLLDHLTEYEDRVLLSFFFDFSDTSKRTVDGMLRSLAFQLYRTMTMATVHLDALYRTHDDGRKQPTTEALLSVVCEMLASHKQVTIILDALDESINWKDLISRIKAIISKPQLGHVQLICTSRPEAEFQRNLPEMIGEENCLTIDKRAVDRDVRSYVTAQLVQHHDFRDKNLSQDLLKEIQSKVGDGADGMFRWAFCQLDTLSRCPHITAIRETLRSLPRGLNETYKRMLESIPADLKDDSTRLLQFLVHSKRPLRLAETKEVIATQIKGEVAGGFNVESRLFCKTDILNYCPGLVVIVRADFDELHLSHFSVKEYLLKDSQIKLPAASIPITITCLAYLMGIEGYQAEIRKNFPMARLAAEVWTGFAASAESDWRVVNTVVRFLLDETTFQRWCQLYQEDRAWDDEPGSPKGSRLYYACLGGLSRTTRALLEKGADVNAQGGKYGNALQAASYRGHIETVKVLLEKGADINAQGGDYGNALQAASSKGHDEIVKVLLEKGADINAQGGDYGNALQAASFTGHDSIVKLLLEKGADINAYSGDSNALHVASSGGHDSIVKLLLEKGADVNAQGGRYGNALQAASLEGHDSTVKLLLEKGADINAQGGRYGNALQAASLEGHDSTVKLLLEKGADINAYSGDGNALHVASAGGHDSIVKLLLEKGVDVNAQGGRYGNALYAASSGRHDSTVKLLLEKGADVNAQGDIYGNALYVASLRGHDSTVKLLLEKGADVNVQGGYFGNALQAASFTGHDSIVKLLLEKGADVNAQGGRYGNALQAASLEGHNSTVKLLLEKGADINAQGGEFGNALQAASLEGHDSTVKLLLEKGVDVNAQGGYLV